VQGKSSSQPSERVVDALIFDLDGTLIDTLDDIADALNRVLAARALPVHERAAVRRMVGGGVAQLAQNALPAHARELAGALLEDFRRDYLANLIVRSAPYPGIVPLLDALAARAIPLCVLSNKLHEPTQRLIATLLPAVRFVEVVGERPGRPRKPDPTVALELAASMRIAPERCGVVGDSSADIHAAHAAGMRSIAVTWGFRDADELRAEGAHVLIDRAEQLLAHVR
jgi:phosphoglycolate phosphatase